ncbi:MAG: DUF5412 family protein [Sarcina sp.]
MKLKKGFFIVGAVCSIGIGLYFADYNSNGIKKLTKGDLILEEKSPADEYILKMYRVKMGELPLTGQ